MKRFTIEYVHGAEGNHFAIMSDGSGMRVAGAKACGGGRIIEAIEVNPADVFEAFGMPREEAKALAERLTQSEGER